MIETLRGIHIFAGISEECLEYLSSVMQPIPFKAGEEIIKEGETGKSMYMIESGSVEVVKGRGDKQVILAQLEKEDFFGEMALIDIQKRSAGVIAKVDTVLYALTKMDLLHLFELDKNCYSIIILNIARDISRRLRKLDAKYAAISC